jgi:excisionase family DNA binding protein
MPEVAEAVVPAPRLYRVGEAATVLRVSPWSVYQMVYSGALPCIRTGPRGRTLRIAEDDLREHLSRARSIASPAAAPVVPADSPKRRTATKAKQVR